MFSLPVRPLALLLMALLMTTSPNVLAAQRPPDTAAETTAARRAMDRLSAMEGHWSGTVEMRMGPGEPMQIRQTERIRRAGNGTALIIEGSGRLPGAAPDAAPVFEAAAVLTFDAAAGRYLMLAAGGSGRAVSVEPEVRDDGLTWAFDVPGGSRVRYVITIEGGTRWRETGEMSPDGGRTWQRFLTMDLTKQP